MKRIFQKIRRTLRGRRTHRRGDQNRTHLQPRGEQLEPRRLLSSDFAPWHNYALPEDVNNDGQVSLFDMVLANRQMRAARDASTPQRLTNGSPLKPGEPNGGDLFPDVDGDNQVTTNDVHLVARHLMPEGQGVPEVFYDLSILQPGETIPVGVGLIEGTIEVDHGDTFELIVSVEDIRTDVDPVDRMGTFRAFTNVTYDHAAAASAAGPIIHGADYLNTTGGVSTPGFLNTVGGTQTTDDPLVPLGSGPFELFRISITADEVGTIEFRTGTPDLTDDLADYFSTFLFTPDPGVQVDPADIDWDILFVDVLTAPVTAMPDEITIDEALELPDVTQPSTIDVLGNDLTEGSVAAPGDLFIADITGATEIIPGFQYETTNGGIVEIVSFGGNLNGAIEYTPADDFASENSLFPGITGPDPDTFGYIAEDNFGNTAEGTVEVNVQNVDNDPPMAVNDPATPGDTRFRVGAEDLLTIDVASMLENDIELDLEPLVFTGATATASTAGTIDVSDPAQVIYDPNGQFESLGEGVEGTDEYDYTIEDYNDPSVTSTATVTITVVGVNDLPVWPGSPGPVLVTTDDNKDSEGVDLGLLGITDPDNGDAVEFAGPDGTPIPDGDVLTFIRPNGATVSIDNDGNLVYDPTTSDSLNALNTDDADVIDPTSPDEFFVTAVDGNGGMIQIPIEVTIEGADDGMTPGAVEPLETYTDEPIIFWIGNNLGLDQQPNILSGYVDPDSDLGGVFPPGSPITQNSDGSFTYDPTGLFPDLEWDDDPAEVTFPFTVESGNNAGDTDGAVLTISVSVNINMPGITNPTPIYADVNNNNQFDEAEEHTIGGVQVQLQGTNVWGDDVIANVFTDANGNFNIEDADVMDAATGLPYRKQYDDDIAEGLDLPDDGGYTLSVIWPRFLVPLDKNDPDVEIKSRLDAESYDAVHRVFGLYPMFIHPQDYLASTRDTGIVFGLDQNGNHLWHSKQEEWDNATDISASMNAAGTQLTITVDGMTKTIDTTNNPDFFHRGENQHGMVVQIYGSQLYHGLL